MRREVKIGVFAVVMLGCLWGGIRFLSGIDIFSRNIPYYVAYPEISGIQTATPVTIQGVKVGTVTAIGFDPSVSRDVVLQLTVRRSFRIPRDSKARIYSDGFMGGKAIAIEMGDSPQLLSKGDTLVAAETRDMLAAAGTELADVKERLTRVMDNLSVTLESVNAVLKDNKGNIDGTLTHLNSISGNMDAVLAAEKGSLRTAIDNIGKFSTALGENSERFSSMIANLDRFSQQLTEADIDSLSLGLRTTLGELNRTVPIDERSAALRVVGDGERQSGGVARRFEGSPQTVCSFLALRSQGQGREGENERGGDLGGRLAAGGPIARCCRYKRLSDDDLSCEFRRENRFRPHPRAGDGALFHPFGESEAGGGGFLDLGR